MASENPGLPSASVNATNSFPVKRRGHSRRRNTAAERARERQAPLEECHIKSLAGIRMTLQGGVTEALFKFYLGEHQSQIFYGGLEIKRPNQPVIHVGLGQAVPIDLREITSQQSGAPKPCFATPTHIFRRFPTNRLSSSASCDLKKITGDAASPDESDASCPTTVENSKNLSLLFPNRIPRCGLPLISFRVYFPVHYMASANDVRQGARRKIHFPPHRDEVVAYQTILTMEVSEFVNRVFRGFASVDLLMNCSSELPIPPSSATAKMERATRENCLPTELPTFLILPFGAYNRVLTMKKRLELGWSSPPCPNFGIPMRLTKTSTAEREPNRPLSWSEWTGLDDAVAIPPWIISKIINGESPSNVRIVFVRRQSEDCEDAIWRLLRKSEFGPARIRRTRAKGTDQLVMKVKQLLSTAVSPSPKVEESVEKKESDSSHAQHSPLPPPVTPEVLNFREVWSRDYRSDPYIRYPSLGPLVSLDDHPDAAEGLPGVNNNFSLNVDSTNVNSVVRKNGDQMQEPSPYHRPTRACLPPQRLQSVDRELEKVIHRSLAEKHRNAVSGREMSVSKSRKQRQKRVANSSNSKLEEPVSQTCIEKNRKQTGMKRTYSEAELQGIGLKTRYSEVEHNYSNKRQRANSPSAISDSAISTKRTRKVGKRKQTTDQNSDNRTKSRKIDYERPPKKTIKSGDSTAGFTINRTKSSTVRSYTKSNRYRTNKVTEALGPASGANALDSDDPYALPSSPLNNNTQDFRPAATLPKKKKRSPSPDPPVLLPEGELENGNCELQNGIGMVLNGKAQGSIKNKQETSRLASSLILNNQNSQDPIVLGKVLTQSSLRNTSPPPLSAATAPETGTDGGPTPCNLHFTNLTQPINDCSSELSTYPFNLPSSIQPHICGASQPISSTNFLTQSTVASSALPLQLPIGAPHLVNSLNSDSPLRQQDIISHPNSFHMSHTFWNGVLAHSGSQPATMWTPRETPLPAPDNNSTGNIHNDGSGPRLINSGGFPMTLVNPGSVVPITSTAISAPLVGPSISGTPITPPQLFMNAFTNGGCSLLTPEMATAAFVNYYSHFCRSPQ